MSHKTIAIIGNPNCGKSTLFNCLTGSKQTIGNWSGVTVDKKMGQLDFQGEHFTIVDLPGIYSLSVSTQSAIDEKIACEFMLSSEVDAVINIIDASNLKRNLYLTLQLKEMQIPCILALNMMDIAKQRDIQIDCDKLSKFFQCPVVPLVLSKNQGLNELKSAISHLSASAGSEKIIDYASDIESKIQELELLLSPEILDDKKRFYAIRLLEKDAYFSGKIKNPAVLENADSIRQEIEVSTGVEADIVLADARYQKAQEIVTLSVTHQHAPQKNLTQRLDSVLMHPWFGIPIFLTIMYLMFELSMNIGTLLQPLFNLTSTAIFVDGANYWGMQWHLPMWLTAIFANGVGLGINTVMNFIPQIGLMFLFLSLLEDSGYMARAAFVMDRFMQFAGLPGKSFVPLIVGFGCNVPSIMAARTLDTRRDRILTSMMAPFMSCGARLAIFVIFASAFFPHHGGIIIFLLYLTGIMAAILTGLMLKKTLLIGECSPFIMELPPYHLPLMKNISLLTWSRLKRFIFRAGKMIIPICILVGSLNAITPQGKVYPYGSQDSILSQLGRAITPILSPMGITQNNWPATVGLMTGTLAKEVVVGTLNTLYSQQKNAEKMASFNLGAELKSAVTTTYEGFARVFTWPMMNPFTANEADHEMSSSAMGHMVYAFATPAAAFAYLLFVLLYVPCISTMSVLAREIGKVWAWGSILWSFNVAYVLAVIFYQAATWFAHPFYSSAWILGLLLWQAGIFLMLRIYFSPKGVSDVAY
jgi:ferrous iron transport protein B